MIDLTELRRLRAAARHHEWKINHNLRVVEAAAPRFEVASVYGSQKEANAYAAYIVAAANAVPALCDEIERLRTELAESQTLHAQDCESRDQTIERLQEQVLRSPARSATKGEGT
jgi:hypothetical protein